MSISMTSIPATKRPSISRRALAVPPSPIRKLAGFADAARQRGIKVYNLNIGQPDIPTPPQYFEALRSFNERVVSYGHSKGHIKLLEGWSRYYQRKGLDVTPAQVQVTTGGSEAIQFAVTLTCDAGDNIVTSEPFYTNYYSLALGASVDVRPFAAEPALGYCLPARSVIEKAINEKTRAILICSPNNPTGTVLTRDEMATVVQIAEEHNLFIISDEVYREFCYGGTHVSIWQFPQVAQRAILIDSISKRFSACGARIGALISRNEAIMDGALRLGQARLCSATVEQLAAVAMMDLDEEYYAGIAREYVSRRDVLIDRLQKMPGVHCETPHGAFYAMVSLPVDDADRFCQWMLTDFNLNGETVMMAPGAGFYATPGSGRQEARIAYVLEKPALSKAMDALAAGLAAYK
jgi:aspartate aminotransferase